MVDNKSTNIISMRDDALNNIKKYLPEDKLDKNSLIDLKFNIESYLRAEEILNPIKIKEKTFDSIDDIFSKSSVILSLYDSIKYVFKRELSPLNILDGFWIVEDENKNFYISNRSFSLNLLKDNNFRNTEEGQFFNFFDQKNSNRILSEYISRVEKNVKAIFDNPKYNIVGVKFRIKWKC